MRSLRRCLSPFIVAFTLVGHGPARTSEIPPFKAHALTPATEASWIATVQNTKTDDGTTILQTLRYAEQLRPSKFKVGAFEAGYNGASGEPEGISVDFWIGAKREPGDAFSIFFEVKDEGGKIIVPRPKTRYGGTAAEAAVLGRDGLIGFIDEQYRENCEDPSDGAKLC